MKYIFVVVLTVYFSVTAMAQILPPTIVAPVDGATNVILPDITFEWNAVPLAIEYQFQISDSSGFTFIVEDITTDQILYTLSTLLHEREYFWRIRSIDGTGPGAWSTVYSFFTEEFFPQLSTTGFNGALGRSRVDVGDYNGDNEYDYLLSADIGSATFRTYIYTSNSYTLSDFSVTSTDLGFNNVEGEVRWLDFDNDGDLDAFVTGWNATDRFSQLYENNSGWIQIANPVNGTSNFPGLDYSTISAGDFNGDGLTDILLTGFDGISYIIHLYIRDSVNGYYTLVTDHGIPAIEVNSVDFADVDFNGSLDLLITGIYLSSPISALLVNDGSGYFSQTHSFLGVQYGKGLFGDYDNDGDFDVVVSGENSSVKYSRLYQNSSGTFIEVTGAGLPAMMNCSLQWGDYDNDGDLDLLMYGDNATSVPEYRLFVCENTGADTFTAINFTGVDTVPGTAQWTDYNFDGKLDIFLCASNAVHVLRNNVAVFNQNPQPPLTAWETVDTATNSVLLEWGSGTDDHTPHSGLTYNIYIGRSSGTTECVSPMAYINGVDNPPGFRYVFRHGNAGKNIHAQITGLTPGVYYWGVQSIDSGYIGSPFSSERHFIVGTLTSVILISPADTSTNISYAPSFEWAPISGAVSYILQYAESTVLPDWNDTALVTTQSNIRTTKATVRATLGLDTLYYWRVGAVMADNTVIWSTEGGGSGAWSFRTASNSIRLEYAGIGLFEDTAVNPQRGFQSEEHVFRVKYTNADNYLPVTPKIYFNLSELPDSWIELDEVDVSDTTTSDGKLYQITITDMRFLLTGTPSQFYEENFVRFEFEFIDVESNVVRHITYPKGTPIQDVINKEHLWFMNFRNAIVMYNSVIRGAVNVLLPNVTITSSERITMTSDPALVWTDGTLSEPKSEFLMHPLLMNPDFVSTYNSEWCLVPEQLFTRYNFLTMAPAGTHTLSFQYYRNAMLVTPFSMMELPQYTINTVDIMPSGTTESGPIVFISTKHEPIRVIAVEHNEKTMDILFAESLVENVAISWKQPLKSKEGIYYKDGLNYRWIGKANAPLRISGTYTVREDTVKPVIQSIAIKNGMLLIKASDSLSGIETISVLTDKGTFCNTEGVFPLSVLSGPSALATITVKDRAGNLITSSQQIEAGTIPKIFSQNKNIINYPNPFNPATTVEIRVHESAHTSVSIYNARGNEVKVIHNAYTERGVLVLTWDGKDKTGKTQPSGVYYVKAVNGGKAFIHKIVLVK